MQKTTIQPRRKRKMYLGKGQKKILKLIAAGTLVSASLVAPNLPSAFKGNKRKSLSRSFKYVYDKNLIILSGEKVHLTKKGQKALENIESEEIMIPRTQWDGIWRIIAYDIPDVKKKERDYFRRKLTSLGFKELQKSMMVIPYECKEEIAVLAQSLSISPFVMHLITDHLPEQRKMTREFQLEN